MPYKGVGRVGNATKEAAVSLTALEDGKAVLKVYTTGVRENSKITVKRKDATLYETCIDLSPEQCFETEFAVGENLEDCVVTVMQGAQILVSYKVYKPKLEPVPKPADAIPAPEKLKTTEELYLAATHLEQYRHATREPADYYLHGLELDGTDIRLNNGYGLLLYRRGRIKESIRYFRQAVKNRPGRIRILTRENAILIWDWHWQWMVRKRKPLMHSISLPGAQKRRVQVSSGWQDWPAGEEITKKHWNM